ncbi:G-patch domain-containing protein [Mycena kentingensis (nom. inval.)]|nr:G-patch domain-containing protein [Mycena kentingensis (nom. inval.)]
MQVSFTVRRPSPPSRQESEEFRPAAIPARLNHSRSSARPRYEPPSSSDEDEPGDELVSAFDAMGAQRCVYYFPTHRNLNSRQSAFAPLFLSSVHARKKPSNGPLVIPALKNRDWRELARKRRSAGQFVPESAKAATGKDGSVGGLGTRDTINNGPALSGLQLRTKAEKSAVVADEVEMTVVKDEPVEETDDDRALRAVLAEASSFGSDAKPVLDAIPIVSESDALKQDVDELPDVASLEDYARVPVEQFGLALLRGMGWKEGTAASRKPGKGLVQPYLPEARPALLGIGAKPQEVYDDGSDPKQRKSSKKDMRYVPILKQGSAASSRHDTTSEIIHATKIGGETMINGNEMAKEIDVNGSAIMTGGTLRVGEETTIPDDAIDYTFLPSCKSSVIQS